MKTIATDIQIEAIRSIFSGGAGKVFKTYLNDLLSFTDKKAVFENDITEKCHLNGRSQQLHELIELSEKAEIITEARKRTK
jgi:hypothetical protein